MNSCKKYQKCKERDLEELDELVMDKLVIRHKFSKQKDPNIERNSIYYLLNWSKVKSKQLLDYYYDNSTKKDEKAVHDRIDQYHIVNQLKAINKVVTASESTMPEKELFRLVSLYGHLKRKFELICVRQQIRLNHDERDPAFALKAINYVLSKGYPLLDTIIKFSADEKIGVKSGIPIYRYSTLWEIMEKTGLLDKFKDEIP